MFLYLGGEGLVRGALSTGLRLGLSPLLAGLTIVAMGTSTPELGVSLKAASAGVDGLAVGNVVGSNICNVLLILGLTALIRPIRITARLVRRDVLVMVGCTLLVLFLFRDSSLSATEGLILLSGLVAYLGWTVWQVHISRQPTREEYSEALPGPFESWPLGILLATGGLLAIVLGGDLFVRGGVQAATALRVPPAVIGLSVVAIGTSLPEIATSAVAAWRGHGDLATGTVIGSNIFNILGVLGFTALVLPLSLGAVTNTDLAVMFGVAVVIVPVLLVLRGISRRGGAAMVVAYVLYVTWLARGAG